MLRSKKLVALNSRASRATNETILDMFLTPPSITYSWHPLKTCVSTDEMDQSVAS